MAEDTVRVYVDVDSESVPPLVVHVEGEDGKGWPADVPQAWVDEYLEARARWLAVQATFRSAVPAWSGRNTDAGPVFIEPEQAP